MKNIITDLRIETQKLKDENLQLQSDNNVLKDYIERLLQYTELSKEDIITACEKDNQAAQTFKSLNMFTSMFGKYL